MTIQAVFFDMGGTIETYWYSYELRMNATPGIQKILDAAGIELGLSTETLLEVITAGLQKYHVFSLESRIELSSKRVWREYILPAYSFDAAALDSIAEKLMVYIETHYYQRKMRPEVPQVLAAIKAMGLKIGLISNANSRGQAHLSLNQYGIQHYFDPIVLSSEYGVRKPDPAIFHYAARLMNVPTSACVYIGDRIARDIVGAQKAGFRLAVQIKHDFDHGEADDGAVPHSVITSMTDLVEILKVEMSRPVVEPDSAVRALLFDAGDILYRRPQLDGAFNDFLISQGVNPSNRPSQEITALNKSAYSGQIEMDEYQEAYVRLYGIDQPEQIARGKMVLEEENKKFEFFEGVAETLITLKNQGYLLGIITDTTNTVQTKLGWFERGGFGSVWDSIISSKELGVSKPDSRLYQAAITQLGVPAGQAAFVGHRDSELDGARTNGLITIAFNYDEGATADYYIETFPDLLDLSVMANQENNQ